MHSFTLMHKHKDAWSKVSDWRHSQAQPPDEYEITSEVWIVTAPQLRRVMECAVNTQAVFLFPVDFCSDGAKRSTQFCYFTQALCCSFPCGSLSSILLWAEVKTLMMGVFNSACWVSRKVLSDGERPALMHCLWCLCLSLFSLQLDARWNTVVKMVGDHLTRQPAWPQVRWPSPLGTLFLSLLLLLSTCLSQDTEGKGILYLRGSPLFLLKSVVFAIFV